MINGITAAQLINKLNTEGGFSYNVIDGSIPGAGYMVSIPGAEAVRRLSDITELTIKRYTEEHAQQLAIPGAYLGGWVNGCNVYLDVSINVESLAAALSLAREYRQLAIYDLSSGESIYLAAYNLAAAAIE